VQTNSSCGARSAPHLTDPIVWIGSGIRIALQFSIRLKRTCPISADRSYWGVRRTSPRPASGAGERYTRRTDCSAVDALVTFAPRGHAGMRPNRGLGQKSRLTLLAPRTASRCVRWGEALSLGRPRVGCSAIAPMSWWLGAAVRCAFLCGAGWRVRRALFAKDCARLLRLRANNRWRSRSIEVSSPATPLS